MNKTAGFTLIELMVVIAIIGFLAAWGLPALTQMTQRSDVATDTNRLLALMQYARSEAVTNKQTVTVCSSTNGATCAGDTNWNQAVIVLQNANVLRSTSIITSENTISLDAGGATELTFNADGTASAASVTVCALPGIGDRQINVNGSGQARSGVIVCP